MLETLTRSESRTLMPLLIYLCGVLIVTAFLIPGPGRQWVGGLTGAEAAMGTIVLIALLLVAAVRLALWPSPPMKVGLARPIGRD